MVDRLIYKNMEKEIILNGQTVKYNLNYKDVKNINLRIKADGSINVSANFLTRQSTIEKFLTEKSSFIINALEKYKNAVPKIKTVYFSEDEVKKLILELCENIYPYFEKLNIKYPEIRFRKMVSQWGNCYHKRNILTFNTNLMYAPEECIEYVVAHEFIHFLQPNHSQKFYNELAKIMPDWRIRREKLKTITIT